MISLRPTKSSVLNFTKRFFAGFTRLAKSTFDMKDTWDAYKVCGFAIEGLSADADCQKWISKSLVKDDTIEDIRRPKRMFTHCVTSRTLLSSFGRTTILFSSFQDTGFS
jgi:hypothetical protein